MEEYHYICKDPGLAEEINSMLNEKAEEGFVVTEFKLIISSTNTSSVSRVCILMRRAEVS